MYCTMYMWGGDGYIAEGYVGGKNLASSPFNYNTNSYLPILFVCGHIRSAFPAGKIIWEFSDAVDMRFKAYVNTYHFLLQLLTN
jgi:hypothetical protein